MTPLFSQTPLFSHEIPGGAAWSVSIRAGRTLTLTTTGDGANVSTLVFAADRLDRMNLPDTLKAQMTARILPPVVLMSDRGLALASVIASSVDWHDALCGFTRAADLDRFTPTDYQHDRNSWHRSARELFLVELAKYGMGEADLHGTVNFFSKVTSSLDPLCSLSFQSNASVVGDHVTLRAEQDLLIVLATTPHPLDQSPTFDPAGVRADVGIADPWDDADPSATFRAESARALEQTRKAFA
ncbi:urea carboxylase-associated protein 2 [Nakamurella sp. UYEF19]|uniref:urea amidolyase associated protein UAAP1 n=1 Tax=Nakamurella sp. UYEF19 TaxID=1756392 RepID=UPI0033966989